MTVDLSEVEKNADPGRFKFGNGISATNNNGRTSTTSSDSHADNITYPSLGKDGLPEIGTWVEEGDPLYCVVDTLAKTDRVTKHKDKERACVQVVRLIGNPATSAN
eukprot:CAMPEP_0172505038 /NCGR_PEP_ID=MMETSP1066-20121228/183148_1 /TAXON_ID=671091 /ORGANISM="Coscinodiscus wailesii, Strain CCMP2513" /LENGTH=105 /DNA_ID=CAMNT_0013281483 /DNA_START=26 /DNA_END=340 /DNA_ORIENTATION=-